MKKPSARSRKLKKSIWTMVMYSTRRSNVDTFCGEHRCLPVHCLYSERYMVGNSAVSTNLVRVNLDLVPLGYSSYLHVVHVPTDRYFGGVMIHSTVFAWLRWRLLYFSIVCPSLVHFSIPTIRSCQNTRRYRDWPRL